MHSVICFCIAFMFFSMSVAIAVQCYELLSVPDDGYGHMTESKKAAICTLICLFIGFCFGYAGI